MKVNGSFVLRQIDDEYILVPVGETAIKFEGMAILNEVGKFIWDLLNSGKRENEIIQAIINEYEVTAEEASQDLNSFLEQLKSSEILTV